MLKRWHPQRSGHQWYPQDTYGIPKILYRRHPQDTAYPQDTDGVLRMPRCPGDSGPSAGSWYPEDTVVSSGHRIPRMPFPSQDANSHFQAEHGWQSGARVSISLKMWPMHAPSTPRPQRVEDGVACYRRKEFGVVSHFCFRVNSAARLG